MNRLPDLSPENSPLSLVELRHPLLLWQQRRQGGKQVVPVPGWLKNLNVICLVAWVMFLGYGIYLLRGRDGKRSA